MEPKIDIQYIPLDLIDSDNSFNCRDRVTFAGVVELAKSIRQDGLLQPVVVRPRVVDNYNYQLIAGYRRFKSFKMLFEEDPVKYAKIPATIRVCDDLEAKRFNLMENIQREELNLKEEAAACLKLMEDGLLPEDVCATLGKSMGWFQIRKYMMELPGYIQDEVVAYNFTQQQIMELWRAPDDEARIQMVLKVKGAKEKGEKITRIVKRERPLDKKLVPKKDEIYEKMEEVAKLIGFGIVTRALAWCAGGITDREFNADVNLERVRMDKTNVTQ